MFDNLQNKLEATHSEIKERVSFNTMLSECGRFSERKAVFKIIILFFVGGIFYV